VTTPNDAEEPVADAPVEGGVPTSSRSDDTQQPAAEAAGAEAQTDDTDTEVAEVDLEALAAAEPRSKGELLQELQAIEQQRDEYLDDLRRSHADFENYRKRVLREGGAQREQGKADVAGALLEVLDDLDRTRTVADASSDEALAKGVTLVADKLVGALRGVGLERIDATGVAFDPTQHEAVQQQPAEEPRDEPVVQATLRPGYRLGDRVLRAAMVVVEQ
jgi:molecular chaperone GrpE